MSGGPQWRSPGGATTRRFPPDSPEALALAEQGAPKKVKAARDYLGPAIAALMAPDAAGKDRHLPVSDADRASLLSALIIAQALDRLGERQIEAAAVARYKTGE